MISPRLSLGQELSVDRARMILVEAELKRVPQSLELERFGATGIGAVQERAVFPAVVFANVRLFRHKPKPAVCDHVAPAYRGFQP